MLAWVAVAASAAAIDTLLVRAEYHHRPLSVALFVESVLLWLVFTLIGALPSALFERTVLRRRGLSSASIVRLFAWTVLPVVLHSCLDSYTSLGGNTSALRDWRPWVQSAGAVLALAAGAALAARIVRRWSVERLSIVAVAAACACGLAISFHSDETPDEPRASDAARPNVLCLVWDTTRAESLSLYGHPRATTPNLDRLAASAVTFTHARSASVYTLTSHLSMLTGVFPSHHGARMTRQRFHPLETPTIVRALREAGYRTGGFVGTDVLRAQSGISFAFETYDDRVDPWVTYTHAWALVHDLQSLAAGWLPALRKNGLPHWIQDFQRPAREVLDSAQRWIENGDPRPWFCFVNLYDVHWPYLPERSAREKWVEPYDGIVDGYSLRGDRVAAQKYQPQARDQQHLRELYEAELFELDSAVDRFLGALDLQRTAVLLTSDHGEAFGEGGQYEHGNILECQTRVPLLVRPPGGVAPRRVDAPVSGVDVAPTLLALAGLTPARSMSGTSLLGELDPSRAVLVEDRDHPDPRKIKLALYEGGWKLVREGLGAEQTWRLYDTSIDRVEEHDMSAARPEVLQRMRERLDALRGSWNASDERDMAKGEVGNTDALKALGYAEGVSESHEKP